MFEAADSVGAQALVRYVAAEISPPPTETIWPDDWPIAFDDHGVWSESRILVKPSGAHEVSYSRVYSYNHWSVGWLEPREAI